MVYVFLADGFEEIEFITTVDILRRADIDVLTVGIGGLSLTGAHKIKIQADIIDSDLVESDFDMIVLPGGMPGASNLDKSEVVDRYISLAYKRGKFIAAICAAPFLLGKRGLLNAKDATCYPGFEDQLIGANISSKLVVRSGNIITGKGPGATIDFALELVKCMRDEETANKIRESMQCIDLI